MSPKRLHGSASLSCEPHEIVAGGQHVLERAEGVHVMADEALIFDSPEHVGKIEVAGARLQMHFVPIAEAIGEPHLLDAAHIERVDKAGHAFRNEMSVVDRERKLERRRLDAFEIIAPLLARMRKVMNLGVSRFLVEVLEQDQRRFLLGIVDDVRSASPYPR